MKHVKKISSYSAVGSLGFIIVAGLQGCGEEAAPPPPQTVPKAEMSTLEGDLKEQNYFLVIEQTKKDPDAYVLLDKNPTSGDTRAVLKQLDGTEKILTNEELTALAKAEADKVEAGTSELTKEPGPEASGMGMGLGSTLLAAAAGSLIGGMLANKLSQNSNFKRNQQAMGRASSARRSISRPANRTAKKPTPRTNNARPARKPRSGFGSTNRPRSSRGG